MRLYDTRRRAVRELVTLTPGTVGMYVCGATVQSSPHIGHLRSALVYDQLRRWLTASGHDVIVVRNVTDIDDKVLDNAAAAGEGERWWALAYRVEREFTAAYDALGILPPTYEPRATGSIPAMIDLIGRLVDAAHAYAADDGSGDVWFDVASWPDYGELTRQRPDEMVESADGARRGKRDPRDFALWKGAKPGEPASASWPSPWGAGRPGWHIECSAMSERYLGTAFDIHGGGLDLRFPHHENELAQSRAAGGDFASYWVHNGLVTIDGQKMSKSLGNSVYAASLLGAARPIVVRYLLGSAHYRSTIDYSSGSLDEAAAAFGRIEGFLERADEALASAAARDAREDAEPGVPAAVPASRPGGRPAAEARGALPEAFVDAMDDDLTVPRAVAVLHEHVTTGNRQLAESDLSALAATARAVHAMAGVLGFDPTAPEWRDAGAARGEQTAATLAALVDGLLAQRQAARSERDWAAADRVRDALAAAGIAVEDTADGARWSVVRD